MLEYRLKESKMRRGRIRQPQWQGAKVTVQSTIEPRTKHATPRANDLKTPTENNPANKQRGKHVQIT